MPHSRQIEGATKIIVRALADPRDSVPAPTPEKQVPAGPTASSMQEPFRRRQARKAQRQSRFIRHGASRRSTESGICRWGWISRSMVPAKSRPRKAGQRSAREARESHRGDLDHFDLERRGVGLPPQRVPLAVDESRKGSESAAAGTDLEHSPRSVQGRCGTCGVVVAQTNNSVPKFGDDMRNKHRLALAFEQCEERIRQHTRSRPQRQRLAARPTPAACTANAAQVLQQAGDRRQYNSITASQSATPRRPQQPRTTDQITQASGQPIGIVGFQHGGTTGGETRQAKPSHSDVVAA